MKVDLNEFIKIPTGLINFDHAPVYYVAILGTLAWTAVGLRVYTRARILRSVGWDDYTMILALLFFTVYGVAFIVLREMVSGKPDINLGMFEQSLKWLLVVEQFYILCILVLKISLAIFFLRIMTHTWHRWVIYVMVAISTLYSTGYFFFSLFQCGSFSSIEVFAIRRLTGEHCVTGEQALAVSFAHAAVTTSTDWAFAILALAVILRLKIGWRDKVIVALILCLGATGSVASVLRFPWLSRSLQDDYSTFYTNVLGLGVWSWWEMGLGIISGSLATLRPLFRKIYRSRSAKGRVLPGKEMIAKPNLNFSLPRLWQMGLKRHGRTNSNSSSIRKSLIGWPLERVRSTKKNHYAYDDEELLWGWGPKESSLATGKQKFGNTTTVSSDGNWNGSVATVVMKSRDSIKPPRSTTSSYYPEDEQKNFGFLAPLPAVAAPMHTFNHHNSTRGSRLGQQMKFEGEMVIPQRKSQGREFPPRVSSMKPFSSPQ